MWNGPRRVPYWTPSGGLKVSLSTIAQNQQSGSVSIVIISYNHEKYVEKALEAAFSQTYTNCSVLIIDDASTDDTSSQVRAYLTRTHHLGTFVHHESNRGLCATLNEALRLISTDYVVMISADDWMEPNRVSEQVAALERLGPEYGAAYSDAEIVDVDGRPVGANFIRGFLGHEQPPEGDIFLDLLVRSWIPAPAVLIRASVFLSVGAYDEKLPYEDYDMWLRIARKFKFAFTPGCLVSYRRVPGSLTDVVFGADKADRLAAYRRIYKKHLGFSDDADAIIMSKLEYLLISQYLGGIPVGELKTDLQLIARHTRSPKHIAYYACATIGIPSPWINWLRSRSLRL